jgi:hypothetical protein
MKSARSAVLSVVVLGVLNLLAQSAPRKSFELVNPWPGTGSRRAQPGKRTQFLQK